MTRRREDDRRVHPRRKVFLPARLLARPRAIRVHVLDISLGGARLHVASPLVVGEEVSLDCAGRARRAVIAWRDGPKCGVRFRAALTIEELDVVLQAA